MKFECGDIVVKISSSVKVEDQSRSKSEQLMCVNKYISKLNKIVQCRWFEGYNCFEGMFYESQLELDISSVREKKLNELICLKN